MQFNEKTFPFKDFNQFRWAHANSNSFLYLLMVVIGFTVGLTRWFYGIKSAPFFSIETVYCLVVAMGIGLLVPRMGYYLARHIYGYYYQKDTYGRNYSEYRFHESQVMAIKTREDEELAREYNDTSKLDKKSEEDSQ